MQIAIKLNPAERIRRARAADPSLTDRQLRERFGVPTARSRRRWPTARRKRGAGPNVDVPRLKWRQGGRGYIAYPVGDWHDSRGQRCAEVWLLTSGINTDRVPHQKFENWSWAIRWHGWFAHHGFADSKQAAADRATEAWWEFVQTELPRNIELEVAMIVARAPVRPLPNGLLGEDEDFLRKINWHLHDLYGRALKQDEAPTRVKEMVDRLTEELLLRRQAEPEIEKARPVVRLRRRRR